MTYFVRYPQPPARRSGASPVVLAILAVITGLLLLLFLLANPVGSALAWLLSSVAMLVVLGCYRWLDRWEPEPRGLLALAFLWGSSIAVVLAVALEAAAIKATGAGSLDSVGLATVAVQAPFIEEAAKGMFLLIMLTGRRRYELDSLTDVMVYAGVTAVGFAWMEDIPYIMSADSPSHLAAVAVARLVFGPFAHPLFTTMTGIGVFVALRVRNPAGKVAAIGTGYLAAVGMHALWNGSLTLGSGQYFVAIYLFWMVPVFIMMVTLALLGRRRDRQVVNAHLPAMLAAGVLTANEATWLTSLNHRRRAIRTARFHGGPQAGRAVAAFATAAVELIFAQQRLARRHTDRVAWQLRDEDWARLVAARAAMPAWMVGFRLDR